jgi:protein-S-isoprenylcysteine O-methyltransferase Ste14
VVIRDLYEISLIIIFSFAALVFVLLFYVSAPYGKFLRKGWGPVIKAKWAWMIMEFPSPAIITFFFIISERKSTPQILFVILWLSHYLNRTFIYPFRQSGKDKAYPFILVLMAIIFNFLNGFVNGYGIFILRTYNDSWLYSWQFIMGMLIFSAGFIINKTADEKLGKMRSESHVEYLKPEGWLFSYISSPHYLGEIIEWAGWALMTWSLPGFAFLIFTIANLFPRAISSHNWYKQNFPDYPPKRKALIPFIV